MKRLLILVPMFLMMSQSALAKSVELTSAKLYYKQGDPVKALEFAEQGAAKGHQEAELYAFLVELYAEKGDWEKMNDAFKRIESSGDKEKRIRKFGKRAADIVYNEWVGVFNSGVAAQNKAIGAIEAGDTLACREQYQSAVEDFLVAGRIQPDSLNSYLAAQGALNNLAVFSRGEERRKAIEQRAGLYDRMLEIHPDSSRFMLQKLEAWSNFRFNDEVVQTAENYMERFGESSEVLKLYGYASLELANAMEEGPAREEARRLAFTRLQRAYEKNPDDPDMSYDIATLYAQAEEYDKAVSQFEKTLAMEGLGEDLVYDCNRQIGLYSLILADNLSMEEDATPLLEKAVAHYEPAYAYDSGNAVVKQNLGVALIRLGAARGDAEMIGRGTALTQ